MALAGALLWMVFAWVLPSPVMAQSSVIGTASGTSYITPFPPGDVYKLQAYGDATAEDLLESLGEVLGAAEQVDVSRKARKLGSVTRAEFDEDVQAEEQARDVVHIGVISMGLADRGSIRTSGKSLAFGTPAWRDQYGQRLDRLFKAWKRRNVALFVVGLPPLRRSEANAEVGTVNGVLLDRSQANGLRFIDITESFSDETGGFAQFGPDASGNRAKLRDGDGVGLTLAGNRKLAALVATEIKRELALARAERAVPLAGSEIEQKRINPDKPSGVLPVPQSVKAGPGGEARESRATAAAGGLSANPAIVGATSGGVTASGLKAESGRIALRFPSLTGTGETVLQEDLVRPAVTAAVVALLTRKEAVETAQQPFDLLVDDVGDGLSVTTMISATTDGIALAGRRRGPTALAAYTTVWVKGERLEPKPGRADDFSWPRRDVLAASETASPSNTVAGPTLKPAGARRR